MSIATEKPRLVADFQNMDPRGRLRLDCPGTLEDLERLGLALRERLELTIGSDDVTVDATAHFSREENVWVAVVDWPSLRTSPPADEPGDLAETSPTPVFEHLESRPRSNYRQLWIKGHRIRAEILYRMTVGSEPRTPEEVAADYDVPVEAVREAVAYSVRNKALLDAERAREEASIRRLGLNRPPYVPNMESASG